MSSDTLMGITIDTITLFLSSKACSSLSNHFTFSLRICKCRNILLCKTMYRVQNFTLTYRRQLSKRLVGELENVRAQVMPKLNKKKIVIV